MSYIGRHGLGTILVETDAQWARWNAPLAAPLTELLVDARTGKQYRTVLATGSASTCKVKKTIGYSACAASECSKPGAIPCTKYVLQEIGPGDAGYDANYAAAPAPVDPTYAADVTTRVGVGGAGMGTALLLLAAAGGVWWLKRRKA